ncbi:MAG: ATP-binding protein [Rhodospirillales bacterium]
MKHRLSNAIEACGHLPAAARFAIAFALIVVALGLRLLAFPVADGMGFVTFSPAVALCFLLCGTGAGAAMALLSCFIVLYLFLPPYWSIAASPSGYTATAMFLLSSALIGAIVRSLDLSRAQVATVSRSRERLRAVIDASPTALVLVASDGRIRMANPQTERIFGYSRAQLQSQKLESLLPDLLGAANSDLCADFLARKSSRATGEVQELFGVRQDGTRVPLEVNLSPIDVDNEPMLLAGIGDITVRRELERERRHAREELERSNAALEEFSYAVAHDLRAPLRAISHLAEWTGESPAVNADPDAVANIALLRSRVVRMQNLLDGLLEYSRVGGSNKPLEDVDIADFVSDIAASLAPPAGFTITYEGPRITLPAHRIPIQVVLENLIGNALKHHDRQNGRITVSAAMLDGVAEIRVADDGPGIEEQFQQRIFAIFQTLQSRDELESSGIGLAIVKRKITANGGHIWVESAPPTRGTSFVFTWPSAASPAAAVEPEPISTPSKMPISVMN